LKPETRILVTVCHRNVGCLGVVMRGQGVDGACSGSSCLELCSHLARRGFFGELRYALGDCTCGYPPPPRDGIVEERLKAWEGLLRSALQALESPCGECSG